MCSWLSGATQDVEQISTFSILPLNTVTTVHASMFVWNLGDHFYTYRCVGKTLHEFQSGITGDTHGPEKPDLSQVLSL